MGLNLILLFQCGLYHDIAVGLQNCKLIVACVSDEVSKISTWRYMFVPGSGGRVVKLLACRTRGRGSIPGLAT